MFHQVLLQSLAVPDPSELVNLSAPGPKPGFESCGRAGDCDVVFSYAMFRDLQKTQTVFTDIAAHVGFGANLAYEAQTSSGEGLLVSGSYFPVLELQPALGRLLNSNDDKRRRRVARCGAQLQLLVVAIWARSNHPQQTGHRQRPKPHHRRRRAEGLRRHDDRDAACRVRPDHAALGAGRRHRLVAPDGLLGVLFARLRPGVTIEAARASLGTQYHAIINDVEAPLQKDMSAQTMALKLRQFGELLLPGSGGGQGRLLQT